MNDKEIREKIDAFYQQDNTMTEMINYVHDISAGIIDPETKHPEKIIGLLKFVIEAIADTSDHESIIYWYSKYKSEYNVRNNGVFTNDIQIIEYVEDRIFKMSKIFSEPISRAEFFSNIKNGLHRYTLMRYAITYVLIYCIDYLDANGKVLLSRYEMTHAIRNRVMNNFTEISMGKGQYEKKFISNVKKFSEELLQMFQKSSMFVS